MPSTEGEEDEKSQAEQSQSERNAGFGNTLPLLLEQEEEARAVCVLRTLSLWVGIY